MNGKTVNKSISFLFCDRFWLSSKQWIDFLNNSSYIKPGQCTLRSLNFSPFAALSIFSLFFFRFHFQGLNILPMEENLLFLSGGGVCCVVVLSVADFISPFFFLSEKKKSNTLNNQYRFVIISLLMSFSILSQIVILNQYRVWGNDQQMQRADLTIKTQCYKVTLDGLSYIVETIVPFHYMLVQCRYLSFTKYLTPHFVTLVDCMNGQKVLIVGSINTQPESSRLQNSMNINTQGKNSSLLYLSL